jgi:1-acyl-sn-glycerol-3-phosphate acyltransferase
MTPGPPRRSAAELLRAIAQYGTGGLGTLVLGPPVLVLSLVGLRRSAYRLMKLWCRLVYLVAGVRFRTAGLELVPASGPYLVVSNHSSHLDGPALILALPHPVFVVIKKELARVPLWGQAVVALGFIAVDRGDSARARAKLAAAIATIRAGRHLLVFPEGTRCPDDGMLPFKKGGFHLAVDAQVPIVPVAVNLSRGLMPKGVLASLPGTLEVVVGEPIPTVGLDREAIPDLLERTRAAIIALRRGDPDFAIPDAQAHPGDSHSTYPASSYR